MARIAMGHVSPDQEERRKSDDISVRKVVAASTNDRLDFSSDSSLMIKNADNLSSIKLLLSRIPTSRDGEDVFSGSDLVEKRSWQGIARVASVERDGLRP